MLTDEPLKANFRFGLLLELLDKAAEETALAYAADVLPGARFVTAAIDSIRIRNATLSATGTRGVLRCTDCPPSDLS